MEKNKEYNVDPKLGISFSLKRRRVLIHRSTIKEIGNPEYIRFLVNSADKKLVVQACDYSETNSHEVPEWSGTANSFEITSLQMQKIIWQICGWHKEKTYRVAGTLYPEHGLVEFDLSEAKVVSEFRV